MWDDCKRGAKKENGLHAVRLSLSATGELRYRLHALGDGMLGQLPRKDQPYRGLHLARGQRGRRA